MPGIIESYRKTRSRYGTYTEPSKTESDPKKSRILDLTYMKKLIGDVLDHHRTNIPGKEIGENRKWTYVQQWRLQNLLGYVDTPTFVFMIEASVEWCVDCRSSVQPNGKWELYDYELTIEGRDQVSDRAVGKDKDGNPETVRITENVQYLVIGFQFVDVNGNNDLQYEMGRPKAYSDQQITPHMLKEILANQGSRLSDAVEVPKDDVYKDVMKAQEVRIAEQDASLLEMKDQMNQMQDMVAGLITELQTARNSDMIEEAVDGPKPKPKPKTVRRKK